MILPFYQPDCPKNTMVVLLLVLQEEKCHDSHAVRSCATAVLRSAFNHLYLGTPDPSACAGGAMSTLLVCAGAVHEWTR